MQKTLLSTAAVLGAGALTVGVLGGTVGADDHGLTPLGGFDSGSGEGGSEIVAVDPVGSRMFTTNGQENRVDIFDISDPSIDQLEPVRSVDMAPYGDGIQSVAVGNGLVAAAVKNADDTANGSVITFDAADPADITEYEVGVLPDSIAFTDDGRYIVVANEAEPVCDDDVFVADPEGSISIIDTQRGVVRTADFTKWNGKEDQLRAQGVRIFFPGSSASQDLEPEYVSIQGNQAYVTLQEANAVAVVNIKAATVTKIIPLGYQDHSVPGSGLDPSNRDGGASIANWNVLGMYMPDAIALTRIGGEKYFLTANEGDSRDYDCYSEEIRVGDFEPEEDDGVIEYLELDDGTLVTGLAAPLYTAADLDNERLGRLKTTTAFPTMANADGEITQIYSYGGRSFTIWNPAGQVVFDSGDQFEQKLTEPEFIKYFNVDLDDEVLEDTIFDGELVPVVDGRSDDKGPEPEALAVGELDGRTYAFIGLERSGGIMMYDITDPANAFFVDYVNTTTFDTVTYDGEEYEVARGDISPEGIVFIPAADSPNGRPLIAVSFEVSGTTRLFEVD